MHSYVIQDDKLYVERDGVLYDVPTPKIAGIKPRNLEQKLAWAICMDPSYVVKGLIGNVGTGKTMIAVLSALMRLEKGEFQKLIYTRPPAPKQFQLGYLPGNEDEKYLPWVQAFYDQAELLPNLRLDQLIRDNRIEFLNIERVKGRTFRNSIVIVDEGQDCSETTMECLIGRPGDTFGPKGEVYHSEIIIVGDPLQVDAPGCTPECNGLVHLWDIHDQPDVAIVELKEPKRSRAAELSLLLSERRLMRKQDPD